MRRRVEVKITGHHGWALLWAMIAAWDAFAPETLSAGFGRLPTKIKVVSAAIVVGHLFDLLPPWADPISIIGQHIRAPRIRLRAEVQSD